MTSLYVKIQRGTGTVTDYGPAGLNVLTNLSIEAGGPDSTGSATLILKDIATGYDIQARDYVQIYTSANAGTTLDDRLFVGFVETFEQTAVRGSQLVWWTIVCQDADILLDWLRSFALTTGYAVDDGGTTNFGSQITRLAQHVTRNAFSAPTFEDTAGNTELGLTNYIGAGRYFQHSAKTLRAMVQERLDALSSTVYPSAYNPRFFMGFTITGNAAAFRPQLNIYNAATRLATGVSSPKYTFSTAPTVGQKSVRSITRKVIGTNLITSVQALQNDAGTYTVGRYTSPNASGSGNPNIFDHRDFGAGSLLAWDGPVIAFSNSRDHNIETQTATLHGKANENPAENISIISADALASGLFPGDVVRVLSAELGLLPAGGTDYTLCTKIVVSVSIVWEARATGDWAIVRTIELGNQLPELDTVVNSLSGNQRISTGDGVRPNPPTLVSATFTFGTPGIATLNITGTSSTSLDAQRYKYYLTVGTNPETSVLGPIGSPPTVPYTYGIFQSQAGSLNVATIDTHGNESATRSNTFTWTAPNSTPPVNPPTALTKSMYAGSGGYGITLGVTLPASPPANPYTIRYRFAVTRGSFTNEYYRDVTGSPPATSYRSLPNEPIAFNSSGSVTATSVDSLGNESAVHATGTVTWTTSDTPLVPAPKWRNGGFEETGGLDGTDDTLPALHSKSGDVALDSSQLVMGLNSVLLSATLGVDAVLTGPAISTYDPSGFVDLSEIYRVYALIAYTTSTITLSPLQMLYLEVVYFDENNFLLGTEILDGIELVASHQSGTLRNRLAIPLPGSKYFKPQVTLNTTSADVDVWIAGGIAETREFVLPLPVVDSDGHVLVTSTGAVVWSYQDN